MIDEALIRQRLARMQELRSQLKDQAHNDQEGWKELASCIAVEQEKRARYMSTQATLDAISLEFPDLYYGAIMPSIPLITPLVAADLPQDADVRAMDEDISNQMAAIPGVNQDKWQARVRKFMRSEEEETDDDGEQPTGDVPSAWEGLKGIAQSAGKWFTLDNSANVDIENRIHNLDVTLGTEIAAEMGSYGLNGNDRSLTSLFKLAGLTGKSAYDVVVGIEKTNSMLHLKHPLALNLSILERVQLCKENNAYLDQLYEKQKVTLASIRKYLDDHHDEHHYTETPHQKWLRERLAREFGNVFNQARINREIELADLSPVTHQISPEDAMQNAVMQDQASAELMVAELAKISTLEARFRAVVQATRARLDAMGNSSSPEIKQYVFITRAALVRTEREWFGNIQRLNTHQSLMPPHALVTMMTRQSKLVDEIADASRRQDYDARFHLVSTYKHLLARMGAGQTQFKPEDIEAKIGLMEAQLAMDDVMIKTQYEILRREEIAAKLSDERLQKKSNDLQEMREMRQTRLHNTIDRQQTLDVEIEDAFGSSVLERYRAVMDFAVDIANNANDDIEERLEREMHSDEARATQRSEAGSSVTFRINSLLKEISDIKGRQVASDEAAETLREQLAAVNSELTSANDLSSKRIEELSVKEVSTLAAIEQLKLTNKQRQDDMIYANAQIEELNTRQEQANAALEAERTENARIQTGYDELARKSKADSTELRRAYEVEMEQMRLSGVTTVETMEAARVQYEQDIRALREEKDHALAALADAKKTALALGAESERLLATFNTERILVQDLRKEIAAMEATRSALSAASNDGNLKHAKAVENLGNNIAMLEAQLASETSHTLSVTAELARMKEQAELAEQKSNDEITLLIKTIKNMSDEYAQGVKEANNRLNIDKVQSEREQSRLLSEMERQNAELERQKADSERQKDKLERMINEHARMLNGRENVNRATQAQLEDVEQRNRMLDQLIKKMDGEIKQSERALTASQNELRMLRQRADEGKTAQAELKAQQARAAATIAALEKQHTQAVMERDAQAIRAQSMASRILNLEADAAVHASVVKELTEARRSLVDVEHVRDLEIKLATAELRIANQSEGIQTSDQRNREAKAKIAKLKIHAQDLLNERKQHKIEIDKLVAQGKQDAISIAALDEIIAEHNTNTGRSRMLQTTIDELTQKVVAKDAELTQARMEHREWRENSVRELEMARAAVAKSKNAEYDKLLADQLLLEEYLRMHNHPTIKAWNYEYLSQKARIDELTGKLSRQTELALSMYTKLTDCELERDKLRVQLSTAGQ